MKRKAHKLSVNLYPVLHSLIRNKLNNFKHHIKILHQIKHYLKNKINLRKGNKLNLINMLTSINKKIFNKLLKLKSNN